MSARPTGRRSADGTALVLALGGLIAAGVAQAVVVRQPWPAVAGFALGALLFGLSTWRTASDAELPDAAPGRWPARAIIPAGLGLALCVLAGALVYRYAAAPLTHALWAAGLLAIAVGAALTPAPRPSEQRGCG